MGLAEVAPTEMVSTSASDRDGVRTGALVLLDGPNTVVCSSEPVHSPSQSSEGTVGSSSQLSMAEGMKTLCQGDMGKEKVCCEKCCK